MNLLRKFAVVILALGVVISAHVPLLACEQGLHRCAKSLSHAAMKTAAKPMKADHSCCPRPKKQEEKKQESAKSCCHEKEAALPVACATSGACCEMGNAPLVTSVQMAPTKQTVLANEPDPPPKILIASAHGEILVVPGLRFEKPVFDLKTDLRI